MENINNIKSSSAKSIDYSLKIFRQLFYMFLIENEVQSICKWPGIVAKIKLQTRG